MTDLRQAAEMALEALEEINKLSVGEEAICLPAEIDGVMEALRQALEQPEQEPVAFYIYKPVLPHGNLGNVSDGDLPWVYDQDPSSGYSARMLVYTAPPKREWVGYTNDEKQRFKELGLVGADIIEAKLREKNS